MVFSLPAFSYEWQCVVDSRSEATSLISVVRPESHPVTAEAPPKHVSMQKD